MEDSFNKYLETICDNIISFELLTDEEKDAYSWVGDAAVDSMSKNDLMFELIKNTTNWNFYLKKCLINENYELAQKLKKVIEIEIREFKDTCKNNFDDYGKKDEKKIDSITEEIKQQFEI